MQRLCEFDVRTVHKGQKNRQQQKEGDHKEKMNAKRYLYKIRSMSIKIISDQRQIESLRSRQFNITQQLGGDRVQSSSNNRSRDVELVDAIVDLQNVIEDNLKLLYREQAECLKKIYLMEDITHQQILIAYYVDSLVLIDGKFRLKTWERVADEMNHSEVWCYKACKDAINEFTEIIRNGEEK